MKARFASSRAASSGARRMDDGWTVATAATPRGVPITLPRCCVTRNVGPISDCAAVAPSSTSSRGLTVSISASSHGLQARTCWLFGFSCRRRLPRRVKRKCLTVRHVHARPIDARCFESLVEDPTGGSDEGVPLDVLAIARLLADEHQRGSTRAFPEDCLRRVFPEVAAPASGGRFAQRRQGLLLRDELLRAHCRYSAAPVSCTQYGNHQAKNGCTQERQEGSDRRQEEADSSQAAEEDADRSRQAGQQGQKAEEPLPLGS